jgi:hypothetical protein
MNDEQQRPQQPTQSEPQPEPTQQAAPAAEQPPPTSPPAGWGAPPPAPAKAPRWSVRHTIIAAAIAVLAAAAAGGTVYAVRDTSAEGQGGLQEGPREPGEVRVGPMQGGGPMGEVEHGEFQRGEVTAISEDSITVESDDGYTGTYVIDSETVLADGIDKGDDVMITATTGEGDEATATMIAEPGDGPPPRRTN